MLDQIEWMRRYRAELKKRRPSLTEEKINTLVCDEIYVDLGDRYPDDPERAIDMEMDDWDREDMPRPSP